MSKLRGIEQSLPLRLLRARDLAMARFRPMLSRHDLTDQQWRVVRVLAAADHGLDAGEIAHRATLLKPSVSRILQHLHERGLVQRRTDAVDGRRAVIKLTAAGQQRYQQVSPDAEALYREIEARFGATELRELNALLTRLSEALDEPKPDR